MIEIIPAIDIIDGKCVRLTQGDYAQKKVYNEDPLEVAKEFEDIGIKRLHLVDLDGAKAGKVCNWKVLERICADTKLKVDFGGGIKTEGSLKDIFEAGAFMAAIGSVAVKEKEKLVQWIKKFGEERFFIGADVRDGKVAVSGWLEQTNKEVEWLVGDYLEYGVENYFCTDIAVDGMMKGPSIELYKRLIRSFPGIRLTASGGVSSMEDVHELERIGCDGVIIGKAIYENRISIEELKKTINAKGAE